MSPTGNRRNLIARTAVVIGVLVIGAGTAAIIGGRGGLVPALKPQSVVFSFLASRDLGALPARGTGAGQFCGDVGTLGAPEHCYQMQDASGNLVDEVGGLTLTAAGVPRYSVTAGLPVQGTTVDFTSEKGISSDASGYFTGTDIVAAQASVTFVWRTRRTAVNQRIFDWGYGSGTGYRVLSESTGVLGLYANFGTDRLAAVGSFAPDDGAIHCATVAWNGASTLIWIDSTARTLTWPGAYGTTTASKTVALMATAAGGAPLQGILFRYRLDHAVAVLTDHLLLCGQYARPLRVDHPAYADTSWTQTGGARCYATSATTAVCLPGGAAGYAWDATVGMGWAQEPGRTNRILYSSAPVCGTGWTCGGGATIAAAIAPDGSKSAGAITLGGGTVDVAGTGYTALATVHPRLWAKCTGGALTIAHQGGVGSWTVDCTHASLSGAWALLHATHPAVTHVAWTATAGGVATMRFSGLDATVWLPTLTEEAGLSVIPTYGTAVATGDAAFAIDNSPARWWQAGDTVTQTLTTSAGTCLVTGDPLRLSGAVGSECVGVWGGLEIRR